ncbi:MULTISPECIES: hypothetical protein [unclassified Acidiphilium]|uniref:hypothetical protein n=1 Tax=unclassified Acidiphilium TaxID=2617493 RepID=UPI000BC3FA61|nr:MULTISPECIES: hypothetical protein [unclassified Acidiphilium]OYV54516.1 MAG: hypothetical protein B7Z76_14165 [Acidiphilium sp. 20-67-58]HQT62535.1 hypothetical protein [Acidiphilium sp.]
MPPNRSDLRDMDARENLREEPARLTRRHKNNTDKYYVPADRLNPEMSYEWKRKSNMGALDVEHQVMLAENHWQPVQAADIPGMMPVGHEGAIERGGMILMSRPRYLTEEAEQEILDISTDRVRSQEQRLGLTEQGQLPRARPKISRSVAPLTKADRMGASRQIPD